MKPTFSEPEFAAFVAIDWADREHAWSLEVAGTGQRERGRVQQTPEALAAWAAALAARFPDRLLAVALEQSRGALFYALSQFSHLVLYPIHPATTPRYRAAVFPSGRKNDPQDADLLLDLLVRHRDRLRPWRPDTEASRKLQLLVEKRRRLVDDRTAQTNRITDLLKVYFPQILKWFDEVGSPLVAALLERWPTLEHLQAEDPEVLRKFFRAQHCSAERIAERMAEIPSARPALSDHAIIDPDVLEMRTLLRVVATLRQGIAELERAIEDVALAHPDYPIFDSFPGAGPALAPRLLAAFGSQRDRFTSPSQIQAYSGIAPVTVRSGATQFWIHFRWACPKFLRQSFHEFADKSLAESGWARAYYDQQRAKGHGHQAAVRALAFKWIRILFRCWQARTPYCEHIYLRSLEKRRRAPLPPTPGKARGPAPKSSGHGPLPAKLAAPAPCANTVDFLWERVAGFWKFSTSTS